MSEPVRLTCPTGRKHAELWSGLGLLLLGVALLALVSTHWAYFVLGIVVAGGGLVLAWHGFRFTVPVLEVEDGEFRYRRGRYIVRLPSRDVGSYYVLQGQTPSLGLCDVTGRPHLFPSVAGRRAARPYLPLTGLRSLTKVEAFMNGAGIPPRDRSLTRGSHEGKSTN